MSNFNTLNLLHAIREIPSTEISSSEKYILLIILSCANSNNKFYCSQSNLTYYSGLTDTTLRKHIHNLEKKLYIFVTRPRHFSNGKATQYSLNIKQIMASHVSITPEDSWGGTRRKHAERPKFLTKTPEESSEQEDLEEQKARSSRFSGLTPRAARAYEIEDDNPNETKEERLQRYKEDIERRLKS